MTKTFDELIRSVLDNNNFSVDANRKRIVEESFQFLNDFSEDKIIYGINTGFGPMAQFKINEESLTNLQYNLVRSHASGAGNALSEIQTRAVMICRLNTLTLGKSGVSLAIINQIEAYLQNEIYPEIYEKGGVGASGDLVQLAHLALGLIGEGYAQHKGKRYKMEDLLKEKGLESVKLSLRDGLALLNGTSCMSGIALLNTYHAENILSWSVMASSMVNEIVSTFDDSFSEELNAAKQHNGQRRIAQLMREFLQGSKMIRGRAEHFYQNHEDHSEEFDNKVQEYYSIRCVPQILGPVYDTLESVKEVVVDEINSANDNPITDLNAKNVFHGGNFHGDYVSFEMDKLKIGITKLCMLMERQLNFLLNHRLNGVLPPFINKGKLGLNFGLQGMQFVATSSTAENQTLSNPMYVHSIPCNNDNQDIVSMGTNSALIAANVIENTYTVLTIHLISIAQAIDVLNCQDKMCSNSQNFYHHIKDLAKGIDNDTPGFERIELVKNHLKNRDLKPNLEL